MGASDFYICTLGFQQNTAKYAIDSTTGERTRLTGADATEKGERYIRLPGYIVDEYNIPAVLEANASLPTKTISEFSYNRHNPVTGEDTIIYVSDYERLVVGIETNRNSVQLVAPTQPKTSKGNYRSFTISLPPHFTISMIMQALGQMITKDDPLLKTFKLIRTGKTYPIFKNTTDGVLAGNLNGAWVLSQPSAQVVGEPDGRLPDTEVIKVKGKKAKA